MPPSLHALRRRYSKVNKKYGFFLDIDNTLYTKGVICEKNKKAIDYVRERGHFVFINTARSLSNIPEPVLELPIDGYITSIGCSIIINGKKLLCEAFDPNELAEEFDYITQHKMKFLIEGEKMLIGNPLYKDQSDFTIVENGSELLRKFGSEIMPKVFIGGVLPEECMEYLSKKHTVFQHPSYAEYAVEGHSKATGMFFAAEKCGIDRRNCVAMGDSVNDLTMLEAAGISVAMGNSSQEIKDKCHIVTCNAADGGVAQAMYEILSRQ